MVIGFSFNIYIYIYLISLYSVANESINSYERKINYFKMTGDHQVEPLFMYRILCFISYKY